MILRPPTAKPPGSPDAGRDELEALFGTERAGVRDTGRRWTAFRSPC